MKFADKLFISTTAVLALAFSIFGIFMVSSYFENILNREIQRADTESRMYQYLFEMAYQAAEEYGEEFAVRKALDSIMDSVEKEGRQCFAADKDGVFYYGEHLKDMEGFSETYSAVAEAAAEGNTYAYGIAKLQGGYYLVNVSRSEVGEDFLNLGICMDLTEIYKDRQLLLNRYRLALIVLILVCGGLIYGMSRYITRPMIRLEKIAGKIAAGNLELRSQNESKDEIGELSQSFNRMTDRLVEQMKEKETEAKRKEDFTAAFAHELKTPLTSIIGYADMLNSMHMTEEEKREAYYYIYSQGKRLESLSHKLLELVSADRQENILRPVQTKDLEENIRTAMRPVFAAKKIKGKVVFEKAVLQGDFELLLSLFYNLLDNAVKAVEEGGFILLKGAGTERGYEVKVVDNGRGIPESEIHRITEAFYMVDKSRSRREGGAGIGMALCLKIITLHGGILRIDSKPGDGTVVKVVFPAEIKGKGGAV